MARIGSDSGLVGNNSGGVFDDNGNPIVTADTEFGASPLGIAARSQALYFLPNPSFNILPPDPAAPIVDNANALPYWSVEDLSEGRIVATTVFDETAQTWALEIDPTAGSATDSIAIKTRSYLLNDSNFDLRQKALASLEKVNAYAGATQWALTLGAEYFSAAGSSLSSYSIGTVADNATWTSLSGFTTSGTAIVDAAAQYVDLTFTLTTTAAVSSTVKVHINSLLLQTSTGGGGGGGGFLVTEMFTSGATWTKPTGVDYLVAALVVGAGGGGGGGGIATGTGLNGTAFASGGSGGGGGGWVFVQNLYVPDATYSIGVGAGGAGGTAAETYIKGIGTATTAVERLGGAGGVGGASTFGTIITSAGGGGGGAGTANSLGQVTFGPPNGGTAGATTVSIYGAEAYTGGTGGGRSSGSATQASSAPFTFATYPYTSTPSNAETGGSASVSVAQDAATGTPTVGAIGFCGGGGSGQGARAQYNDSIPSSSAVVTPMQNPAGNGGGGGAGASGAGVNLTNSGTRYVRAGEGGDAATNSGGGGGGGGGAALRLRSSTSADLEAKAAAGGNGSSGYVIIAYVA